MRREVDTLFHSQVERILRDFEVVQREEFEAVKEMARLAREENEALKARIEALEAERSSPTVIVPPAPVTATPVPAEPSPPVAGPPAGEPPLGK